MHNFYNFSFRLLREQLILFWALVLSNAHYNYHFLASCVSAAESSSWNRCKFLVHSPPACYFDGSSKLYWSEVLVAELAVYDNWACGTNIQSWEHPPPVVATVSGCYPLSLEFLRLFSQLFIFLWYDWCYLNFSNSFWLFTFYATEWNNFRVHRSSPFYYFLMSYLQITRSASITKIKIFAYLFWVCTYRVTAWKKKQNS